MNDRFPGIRPRSGLWRQLDVVFRAGFPSVCTVALLLVLSSPLGLPGQAELRMAMGLICVFFWALVRPYSMPPPVVFLLGLLLDLLGLEPPGVATALLLLTYGAAVRWKRVLDRGGTIVVWAAFAMVAAAITILEWGTVSLLRLHLLPGWPLLFQYLIAVGLYPALSASFSWADRGIAAPERA